MPCQPGAGPTLLEYDLTTTVRNASSRGVNNLPATLFAIRHSLLPAAAQSKIQKRKPIVASAPYHLITLSPYHPHWSHNQHAQTGRVRALAHLAYRTRSRP